MWTATVLAIFLGDLLVHDKDRLGELALVGVRGVAIARSRGSATVDNPYLFSCMIAHDQFAVFFKVVFALAALATVWMSLRSQEVERTSQGEYYGILLSSALGMHFMAAASNLPLPRVRQSGFVREVRING